MSDRRKLCCMIDVQRRRASMEQMEEVHRHLTKSSKAVGTTPPDRNTGLRARVTAYRRNNSR